jgi:hypothetical protein
VRFDNSFQFVSSNTLVSISIRADAHDQSRLERVSRSRTFRDPQQCWESRIAYKGVANTFVEWI